MHLQSGSHRQRSSHHHRSPAPDGAGQRNCTPGAWKRPTNDRLPHGCTGRGRGICGETAATSRHRAAVCAAAVFILGSCAESARRKRTHLRTLGTHSRCIPGPIAEGWRGTITAHAPASKRLERDHQEFREPQYRSRYFLATASSTRVVLARKSGRFVQFLIFPPGMRLASANRPDKGETSWNDSQLLFSTSGK